MDGNTFNISSKNQHGGITAGIVNIFHRARIQLSDNDKKQLTDILADKSNLIHVSLQVGSGSELTQFAQELKAFLIQQDYLNLRGVHTIMGFTPFKGVNIEKKSNTESVVFIGSLI